MEECNFFLEQTDGFAPRESGFSARRVFLSADPGPLPLCPASPGRVEWGAGWPWEGAGCWCPWEGGRGAGRPWEGVGGVRWPWEALAAAWPRVRSADTALCRTALDGKVLTCAAVWKMPQESEPGSHESPDDAASAAHSLELLCHLDGAAHGSTAW